MVRSRRNRMFAGVCGGVGEYLRVDPALVRFAFVVLAAFGGFGVLLYLILVVVLPVEGQERAAIPDLRVPEFRLERPRELLGYALIALGVLWLLSNAGVFRFLDWGLIWPLVLVAIGIAILLRRV